MSDLVVFHKQLGDTALLEPVLRKLAHATGRPVDLICPPHLAPLVELMPHTRIAAGRRRWLPDRVWAYDWGGRTTRAVALTFCRERHLLIPNPDWVGLRHRLVFQHIQARSYLDRHVSRYFWDETPAPEKEAAFSHLRLERPPQTWAGACWKDEPYVLLNPVSAWKRKSYDALKWARVLAHVRELGLPRIVMTGGTDAWQQEHCAEIAAAAQAEGVTVEDVSGLTSLREFMHMVSRAAMVLCIDGAAAHLARGFGVPCLTIFGPSHRWMWHEKDDLNAAVDASDLSDAQRPDAALVPVERVTAEVTRLAARTGPAHG
jgi:ADP-heptose:LPS heptosyltransferase